MDEGRRTAMLEAIVDELVAEGYEGISMSRALAAAGVSETEFMAEFTGKDNCLFAAYDELTGAIIAKAASECDASHSWPERMRSGLQTLLGELASHPEVAQAVTRSFPGVRPQAYERYVALLSRFEPFVAEGREYSGLGEELPSEVELLAVGAAEAMIFGEVDAGRAGELPGMLPEILFVLLVPFIGPDRAAEEMKTAAAIG